MLYSAPDFDLVDPRGNGTADSPYQTLRRAVQDLETWMDGNQSDYKPGTAWVWHIDCLLRLLRRRTQRLLAVETGSRETQTLIDDSISVAIEINRGSRFAKHLRSWMVDWSQLRILPPQDM
jgi:hypothetical protein